MPPSWWALTPTLSYTCHPYWQAPVYDAKDVEVFTEGVLLFWRTHKAKFPAWAKAAQIVFCLLPNSAMSERVFALVKNLFGEDQMPSLADMLQASLMLNSNERSVG